MLITGESGTGKEIIARAIHDNSPNKDKQFVTLNCGALPESLAESELFGHLKGSFTGADKNRIGKIELATKGPCFWMRLGNCHPHCRSNCSGFWTTASFCPREGRSPER